MHQTYSRFPRHSTPCFCIKRNIYTIDPLWRHYKLLENSTCVLAPFLKLLNTQEHHGEGIREHSSAPLLWSRRPALLGVAGTAFPCPLSSGTNQAEGAPSLTCLWTQMTGRVQERPISGFPSSNEIHFSGHQEFLIGVPELFQGQQLRDALPQVLPRGKTEIRRNDNAKYYCL